MKYQYAILLFLIIISLVGYVTPSTDAELTLIQDGYYSPAPATIFLQDLPFDHFAYFSFDFDLHNRVNKSQKNIAYFKITADKELAISQIQYAVINLPINYLEISHVNPGTGLNWRNCFLINKQKVYMNYEYTIQINKFGVGSSIAIRIPYVRSEGQLMVENLYKKPK